MPAITKNAQLLKFLAQQYGLPGVPRKRLVKLAYMADILARQYLGRPISDFVYIKDHYGPNARDLPKYTHELVEAELAEEPTRRDGDYRTIRLKDSGKPIAFEFTPGENEILAYVAENYLDMELDEFIDEVVKTTDPFKAVSQEGKPLPMHMVDNVRRDEVGFDLEAVLKAERQVAEKQGTTLAEFSRGLRTDITAGRPN